MTKGALIFLSLLFVVESMKMSLCSACVDAECPQSEEAYGVCDAWKQVATGECINEEGVLAPGGTPRTQPGKGLRPFFSFFLRVDEDRGEVAFELYEEEGCGGERQASFFFKTDAKTCSRIGPMLLGKTRNVTLSHALPVVTEYAKKCFDSHQGFQTGTFILVLFGMSMGAAIATFLTRLWYTKKGNTFSR